MDLGKICMYHNNTFGKIKLIKKIRTERERERVERKYSNHINVCIEFEDVCVCVCCNVGQLNCFEGFSLLEIKTKLKKK